MPRFRLPGISGPGVVPICAMPNVAVGQIAVIPIAPTLLTATVNGSTQIDLAWTDNSDNETGFRVYRSTDNVTFTELATAAADATSYSDTSCAGLTQYWYYVVAYNAVGESDPTNTDDATTVADIYVATTGNDTTGDGSVFNPYATLGKALTVVTDGQTIGVSGGTYREYAKTLSDNSVTIKALAGQTPIFVASHAYESWSKTDGQTNVYQAAYTPANCKKVWNGATGLTSVASVAACDAATNSYFWDDPNNVLYVNIGGDAPTSLEVMDVATDLALIVTGTGATLDGLTVRYNMRPVDIRAGGSTIRNCAFDRWVGYGGVNFEQLALDGSTHIVDGCSFDGVYHKDNMIGIRATGDGATIQNCTFTNGHFGVYVAGGTHTVTDCSFNEMSADSVFVNGGTATVRYSVTTDNGHAGFQASTAGTMHIHHCIVNWTKDVPMLETGVISGIVFHGTGTCYHCVVANMKRASTGHGAFSPSTDLAVEIKNCISYNNYKGFYNSSGTPDLDLDYCDTYGDDTDYGKSCSAGEHDIASDPLFTAIGVGTDDFTLQALSPCRGAGLFIAGISEQNPATIGRYEYAAS